MGYFDLPQGELELQLKDENGIYWKCVCFTDRLDKETLVGCKENWCDKHEVLAARFNGREVAIPNSYHWELRIKGEVLGSFKTRREAVETMNERKLKRHKDKTVKVGLPYFVED